jgi:hypothetical protein
MTLNPQEQVEMALKWCDIVSDDPPYEWEKHAKVLAKEVRRLLEREKVLESLLRRASAKLSAYNAQTGGIYAGGEGLQFLMADINATLSALNPGEIKP